MNIRECPRCNGDGQEPGALDYEDFPCTLCLGTGEVSDERAQDYIEEQTA